MMTVDQDRARVLAALAMCAEACNRSFSDETLKAFVHLLRDLPLAGVLKELTVAMGDGKFPSMNAIRAGVLGVVSDADEAQHGVDRIFAAISSYGGYRATEAKALLGELAWEAVRMHGGWKALCNMTYKEQGTIRAQLRDTLRALLVKAKAGTLHAATALPGAQTGRPGLTSAASLLAGILPTQALSPRNQPAPQGDRD